MGRVKTAECPELKRAFPNDPVIYPFVSEYLPYLEYSRCYVPAEFNEREIMNWPDFNLTLAFDEWTANADRHFGNLLFDPVRNSYYLIDFGHAFGGNNWTKSTLVPNKSYGNMLLAFARINMSARAKEKLIITAKNLQSAAARIDYESFLKSLKVGIYAEKGLFYDSVEFLQQRIFRITSLLEEGMFSQPSFEFESIQISEV